MYQKSIYEINPNRFWKPVRDAILPPGKSTVLPVGRTIQKYKFGHKKEANE